MKSGYSIALKNNFILLYKDKALRYWIYNPNTNNLYIIYLEHGLNMSCVKYQATLKVFFCLSRRQMNALPGSAQKWPCAIPVFLQSFFPFGLSPCDHLMTHDVPLGQPGWRSRTGATCGEYAGLEWAGINARHMRTDPSPFGMTAGGGSHLDSF